MSPLIYSGDSVELTPDLSGLRIRNVVLCKVNGNVYLHLIKAVNGDRYLIGNCKGKVNGWTSKRNIYGKVVSIRRI